MVRWLSRPLCALLLLTAPGCGDKDDDTSGGTSPTTTTYWYSSCGDPACSGYAGPFDGLDVCTDQTEGATCSPEGAECDLQTDCNTRMVCTTEDPKASEYGCPQSLARTKHKIHYLSPTDREQARRQLLDTKLATWNYRWDAQGRRARPGFLIDDQPTSPAVTADGHHVDLYGYTSLTVAAVQAQQAELEALRSELTDTRAALAALQASGSRTGASRCAGGAVRGRFPADQKHHCGPVCTA